MNLSCLFTNTAWQVCSKATQTIFNYIDDAIFNKSSAVAEMGDRGHNRHGPKRRGLLCPFRAELGPNLIQCSLGRGLLPYQVASSSISSFGHNGHWTKTGGCASLGEGKLGPHIIQSRLGWGLPPYQMTSWCIQPFGDNENWGSTPFWGRGAGDPSSTMWLGPRPISMPSAILIHPAVWPQ